MKVTAPLLFASILLAQNAATAQPPAPAKSSPSATHAPAATHPAAAHACAKLPVLSPKIPALPAAAPCAKPLYTITTVPPAKLSDASALDAPGIRDYFGIEPLTFTVSYVDTKIGTGELAAPHKWYSVLYTGYLTDGSVFDASSKHPESGPFVLQQGMHKVIPAWDTGFYGMRVGGKRRLFIPWQLAYGARGNPPGIPPNADLVFDVELVSQSNAEPKPPTPPAPPASAAPPQPAPPTSVPPATPPVPASTAPATAPTSTPPKPQ